MKEEERSMNGRGDLECIEMEMKKVHNNSELS
jgi:hypothetical protein